jgi:hypothetical protein
VNREHSSSGDEPLLFFFVDMGKISEIPQNPIVNPTPNSNLLLFALFICIFVVGIGDVANIILVHAMID